MKALILNEFNTPFELREMPAPDIKKAEVLVKIVHYLGSNMCRVLNLRQLFLHRPTVQTSIWSRIGFILSNCSNVVAVHSVIQNPTTL